MKLAFTLFLFSLAAIGVRSAPLERDLGQGLLYCRVHALPRDLPSGRAVGGHPCVLDLRYVAGDARAGGVLLGWLKFQASLKTPVFLLANAETSPALLAPLDSPDAVAGLVILGVASPNFAPDIALPETPATERRAYDALERGAPLDSLLVETVKKPRLDEEVLTREHLADSAVADEDDAADPPEPSANPHPQLIDAVLQRAVQLHRSLLALKRL